LPAQVDVSAPDHVTRTTWVTTTTPRIDLFPLRGFDLDFYRQLARDGLGWSPGPLDSLSVLTQAPSFFVETEGPKGFPRALVDRFERVARQLVPELSGGRFQVTRWETGPAPRPRQTGWIVIERRVENAACGRAFVGEPAGQIWMSDHPGCRVESVFAHDLGEIERHHMRLANARQRGNTDIDVDPQLQPRRTSELVID
ncbi:MAG: hypothetical protein ABL986_19490, partial [Vicinamibacterales bacterium]